MRAAAAPAAGGAAAVAADAARSLTPWADINLARLHLAFGQREQALQCIKEAVRSAQQHSDDECLAYSLLWLSHAHDGYGADAWGRPPPDGAPEAPETAAAAQADPTALLHRCLARAHELDLRELAALAAQALAIRATVHERPAAPQPHTPPPHRPAVSGFAAHDCLPPAALALPAALPKLAPSQPPPLRVAEALRCGADGCSGSVQVTGRHCLHSHHRHRHLHLTNPSSLYSSYEPPHGSVSARAASPPCTHPSRSVSTSRATRRCHKSQKRREAAATAAAAVRAAAAARAARPAAGRPLARRAAAATSAGSRRRGSR